ncbi:MAG: ATP-binding cassette domain-containing protein [Cytophagaceae bacterium]|jgi:phospholipid/cholesterol/gamma-HCH transport system ATP-binding protein|nr:ATP-binding cassette domain-containing protein [Cytophagaceae bacterium]
MIEFNNLNKTFENKNVLIDVSGKFTKGKCNLIIGASGTGKSVLLKTLVGLIQPDTGNILYDGRDFTKADTVLKQDIRREIGMLFQGSALFDSKTVEENVMFPLDMLTQMSKSEKQDRVNYCLQRVGLENASKLMPSQISGGMQKRVGIARAIVNNSKYLYCDEPNSGLDPQTSIRIDNLINDITHEYNITTVVVTHDMNSVLEIGEYVIFMFKGEKVWEGSKKDILDTKVKSLQDFLFANKLIREMKDHQ